MSRTKGETYEAQPSLIDQSAVVPEAPVSQAVVQRSEQTAVQSVSVLEIFSNLARDPKIDISRIKELMELQKWAEEREAEKAFAEAMRSAQAEMVPIVRNAENAHTRSKYATLEIIDAAIRPIYTKHGFSLTFNSPESSEKDGVLMTCTVLHVLGHSRPYSLRGELDMSGPQGKANKTPIQGLSSSVTYLQRILTRMIFNLAFTNEDKDGNSRDDLTEDQQANLIALMDECRMSEQGRSQFLETFGVKALADLQQGAFKGALNLLLAKRRKVDAGLWQYITRASHGRRNGSLCDSQYQPHRNSIRS